VWRLQHANDEGVTSEAVADAWTFTGGTQVRRQYRRTSLKLKRWRVSSPHPDHRTTASRRTEPLQKVRHWLDRVRSWVFEPSGWQSDIPTRERGQGGGEARNRSMGPINTWATTIRRSSYSWGDRDHAQATLVLRETGGRYVLSVKSFDESGAAVSEGRIKVSCKYVRWVWQMNISLEIQRCLHDAALRTVPL